MRKKKNMTDLFPQLKGLKGGDKQAWVNKNLDFIAMLNDMVGFEEARTMLRMKPDTLISALGRAEGRHRPAITHADKAYNMAQRADMKADEALHELEVQANVISGQISETQELKQNLTSYFALMAQANNLMAKLCQATSVNFTEHIGSLNKRKVGLTRRNSRGRLLLSVDRGSSRQPRPQVKHTYFRARRPRSG